jgi:uncharacterized membrane protein YfcA
MTGPTLALFAASVLATSFLAGLFGMAGGVLLMGALLLLVPVADAMVLHGVTMIVANGWRGVLWRRYVLWGVLARYVLGLAVAGAMFASLMIVPDERVIFLVLGAVCFLGLVLPERLVPQADRRFGAELCGFLCTVFQLLSGVSGPIFDVFFVRTTLDRRVVVATKSACQLVTHLAKTIYFGALIGGATGIGTAPAAIAVAVVMAIAGTSLARPLLERMSDGVFRAWTARILMAIGALYLWRGLAGFL